MFTGCVDSNRPCASTPSNSGLVSVSNPWVQQAEGDWMERRRMDLEVEISKRARQTVKNARGNPATGHYRITYKP